MNTILIVGATGQLGRSIVSRLQSSGARVRALVRPDREDDVVRAFESSGVELARADLTDGASLAVACQGVVAIVSTATAIQPRLEGDSLERVDRLGAISLIEAAEAALVRRFVYVSFAELDVRFALQDAKREVEARLRSSRSMSHAVLKPAYFMETWLPGLFSSASGTPVTLFGTGEGRVSWISREDVARYAASAALDFVSRENVVAALGGPEALSQLDVLRLIEAVGGLKASTQAMSVTQLQQGIASADPLAQSFSALMMGVARGLVVEPAAAPGLASFPLTTVEEFLGRSLARA